MKKIESLFDIYKSAVFEKNVDAFTSIFDENVQVFDMWKWSYDGLLSWREMATGWFGSLNTEKVVVDFDNISIYPGEETAGASAGVRFAAISATGKELRHLQNRLTWILHKKNDEWKIIHEHTSGPVDHNTMKVILVR